MKRVQFKIFRGTWASWKKLFEAAAEFASALKPGQLISIAHSEDKEDGVIAVWFWPS